MVCTGGNAIGVDFSQASGADAVVVMVGPGATGQLQGGDGARSKVQSAMVGEARFSILTLSAAGKHPAVTAEGDKVVLGGQTIRLDGTKIVFAKMADPLKIKQ